MTSNANHIVIDGRIIDSSTGVYVQRLLHFLHEKPENYAYTVLVPSASLEKWQGKYPKFQFVAADQPNYSFAEQLSLARQLYRLKPDLVHFTMPQQPLLYIGQRVTTIHDTTLLHFDNVDMNPLAYRTRKLIFSLLVKSVMRRSKAILVPTEFVRTDLIKYARGKYTDKITVTLEAGDPVDARTEAISELEEKQFLFFVGNAFPYKNIRRTIEAFQELKQTRPELHLALAGKKDYFYEQLEQEVGAQQIKDIHFLGFISDGEKRWAYQHAAAFVTASLSEGFHIPLLEAMYEGCPVISSNASCLPEVGGRAARYFDPYSTSSLVKAITQVLDDKEVRTDLMKAGHARVKEFSWERMSDQTRAIYTSVLSRSQAKNE